MVSLVTVLLATHNGERYLEAQLSSIEAQSHTRWHLCAFDDGSTDSTPRILEAFRQKFPDAVTVLSGRPVRSAGANFLRLIRQAPPSDFYAYCDQDDVWSPSKLALLCQEAEKRSSRDSGAAAGSLYISDLRVVNADGELLEESFFDAMQFKPEKVSLGNSLVENSVPGCAMFFDHALRTRIAKLDPVSPVKMHDWATMIIACASGSVNFLPRSLVDYRQHSSNTLGAVDKRRISHVIRKIASSPKGEIRSTMDQARIIAEVYQSTFDIESVAAISAYAGLIRANKIRRVRTAIHSGFLKQGALARLYQLMWI